MKFELVKKDYKDEWYEAKYKWKSIVLSFRVHMGYHTILKFWTVSAFITGIVFSVDIPNMIEDVQSRKQARVFAIKWMKEIENNPEKYINTLDEFHLQGLLEDHERKYSFK